MSLPGNRAGDNTPAPSERAARGPRWLPVDPYSIPRELTSDPAWHPGLLRPKVGKVGTWDKLPADPQTAQPAKWSDPATRCTFDEAFMAYSRDPRFGCIGYMLHGNGIVGIDLDHSIDDAGTVKPWAQAIVDSFAGAYWERSISGTGLRGFCRGSLGDVDGIRSKIEGCSVELYAGARYLVVTGQALATVDALPELQPAIDALRTRLAAGRVRATGTAIGSGLTGPNTNPSAEVLAIVEGLMSSRHSQRLSDVWFRDELHVAGASEDDWALASEIVYQAIRRGHRGDELAQLVEQTMRAGPYRAKWDERRAGVTWLAQDVANAIATVLKRLGDRPIAMVQREDLADVDDQTPTDETPAQIIARLERELAAERSARVVQATVLRAERAEATALRARLGEIMAVLRNDRLSPTSRVVAIVLGETVEQLRSHGHQAGDVMRSDLARKAGVSESTISREMGRLCTDTSRPDANPDAPIAKTTTTEWRDVGGLHLPTARVTIAVRAEASALASFATFTPPDERKHGGPRVKGCPDHPTADLIIRSSTHCAECDRQLGETRESLPKQVDAVGQRPGHTVSGGYSPKQVDPVGNDGAELARAAQMVMIPDPIRFEEHRARRLPHQVAQVGYSQPSWLDEWPDPLLTEPPCDVEHSEIPAVFL